MDNADWTPERLADRMQIEEVLRRYCRAVDRINPAALADVFHADATLSNGVYKGDVKGFVASVAQRHPGVPFATHMVMNALIDFLAPDRAFVESWCLAMEQHPAPESTGEGGSVDRVFRVRYGDVFTRRGGEWRISRRITVMDHIMSAPVDPDLAPAMEGRLAGRRDQDDPVMVMCAELGL